MNSLDIVTVATNNYVDFWIDMVKSADKFLDKSCKVKSFVFTDNLQKCLSVQKELKNIAIEAIEIESLKWPDATLLRYKIFAQNSSLLESEYTMHLDADMLIRNNFIAALDKIDPKDNMFLVAHPGYFRPKGLKRLKFYLRNPKVLSSDLKSKALIGGVGSWETSTDSTAYVARNERKVYVCGGTWMGKSNAIKKLFSELAEKVELDKQNGTMAKWHDESHLNRWAGQNDFALLPPSFCADPTYKQLEGLPVYIEAVDKNK
jgi:hypothetical protein